MKFASIAVALFILVGTACSHTPAANDPGIKEAVAMLMPTEGSKAKGIVRFNEVDGGVRVVAEVEGLNPNQQHAIHIHAFGDCTKMDGMASGGHYNPEGNDHGLPPQEKRHAGDLGNLSADSQGKAHYEITVQNITLAGPKNPILGRGIIVHAKPDDGGQPVGNAGGRIAHGTIGVANPKP